MNSITLVCLFGLFSLSVGLPMEQCTDKFDNINIDEIIGNDPLVDPYVKFLLDQGKCSPEGKELKKHISEALETECSKCTETQKSKKIRTVIKHLINHKPD